MTRIGATVTFLGGQSMFLLKLGVSEDVSSRCPTLVSVGTHNSTRTPTTAVARASIWPRRRLEEISGNVGR